MFSKHTKTELVEILQASTTDQDMDLVCKGFHFDSRKLTPGNLFVALKGENVHGHNFIDTAFKAGASLALIEDQNLLDSSEHKHGLICVDDTLEALHKLARIWRSKFDGILVGITGSMGKTTTKEICGTLLNSLGPGKASPQSFNNHIGVPYTLSLLEEQDKWAVLEMGMNHAGELSLLSALAEPDVVVMTGVAEVHMEFFPDIEAVADAKCEILERAKGNAPIIINGDSPALVDGLKRWQEQNSSKKLNLISYGSETPNQYQILETKNAKQGGIMFKVSGFEQEQRFSLPLYGRHNSLNALACILVARQVFQDSSFENIQAGLSKVKAPKGRLQVTKLPSGKVLIDDAYNANLESMKSGIEVALSLAKPESRIGLLLGKIAEMGEDSSRVHRELGQWIADKEIAFLIVVGDFREEVLKGCQKSKFECLGVEDNVTAIEALKGRDYDILFVKGSNSVGLDKVVEAIKGNR